MGNQEVHTELREYETMEQLFERYKNAYYKCRYWEEREIYATLSEEAENGDEEAIFYLSEIYSTFPSKYGKKRNRILQYGTKGKSMKALYEAYLNGHYCNKDEDKAQKYLLKIGVMDRDTTYQTVLQLREKDFSWRAKEIAGDYVLTHLDEMDIFGNLKDIFLYCTGMRYLIKYDKIQCVPEEIEKKMKQAYEVDWSKIPTVTPRFLPEDIDLFMMVTAVMAYRSKERNVEAMNLAFMDYRNPLNVLMIVKLFGDKVPEGAFEEACIRAWKGINPDKYRGNRKERLHKEIDRLMNLFQKKGTLLYLRMAKLAQEAGCYLASDYVAKAQELLREEAMVSQAVELLETSNYRSAVEELERLAGKDNIEACYQLGRVYYKGLKVSLDVEKAKALMKKAANAGHKDAERLVKEWETKNS